jgi:hypothetical protein
MTPAGTRAKTSQSSGIDAPGRIVEKDSLHHENSRWSSGGLLAFVKVLNLIA